MNDQDIMMNNLEARDMKREEELYLQAQYDKEMVNYSEPVSFDMWKAEKAKVIDLQISNALELSDRIEADIESIEQKSSNIDLLLSECKASIDRMQARSVIQEKLLGEL